jgi:predicted NAD/FAD-binding protein
VEIAGVLIAGACVAISAAQRALSTPVRRLRRRVEAVEGTITLRDGTTEPLGADVIRTAPAAALKLLALAMPVLATALVLSRR